MPGFKDYSKESLFILLEPWINEDSPRITIPSLQEIRSALPKTADYVIFSFIKQKDGLFLLNLRDWQQKKLVTPDNCVSIYEEIMRAEVYLEVRKPCLQYVPPKEIFTQALEEFSTEIQAETQLPGDLAKIIAEYVVDAREIRITCDSRFFKTPKQIAPPKISASPKDLKPHHVRSRPLTSDEDLPLPIQNNYYIS